MEHEGAAVHAGPRLWCASLSPCHIWTCNPTQRGMGKKTCNGMRKRCTTRCGVWIVQWPSAGESANIRHSQWQITNWSNFWIQALMPKCFNYWSGKGYVMPTALCFFRTETTTHLFLLFVRTDKMFSRLSSKLTSRIWNNNISCCNSNPKTYEHFIFQITSK